MKYETPILEIVNFEYDVICASGGLGITNDNETDWVPGQ